MASIELRDVSVQYPIYTSAALSLRGSLLQAGVGGVIRRDTKKRPVVEALRGITLKIDNGERVGLVGRNGAGKTTLLNVLAGICPPASGTYQFTGSISSLMAANSFMEPEMTGYENIHFMGLLLGFSRKQIDDFVPEIESFTELGSYLDMPVRTYSAGMRVRLSFAMITSIKPDILIMDEAIGAGDAHFVAKAMDRATQLYNQANIIVIASHSTDIIRRMCDRVIVIEKGAVIDDGSTEDMLITYSNLGQQAKAPPPAITGPPETP